MARTIIGFDLADLERRRGELVDRTRQWTVQSLDQRIEVAAAIWPDRPYLVFDDETYTYAETFERVRQYAATLADAGVGEGDHVGLLMANTFDFYAISFALSRLAAWTVPLNYLLAPPELAHVVTHSRLRLIVVDARVPVRNGIDLLNATLESMRNDSGTGRDDIAIRVVGPICDVAPTFKLEPLTLSERPHEGSSRGNGDAVSHVFYTSGSTALPKAVTVIGDAMLREAYGTALTRGYGDGWRIITALPPFHIFGLMQVVLAVTFVGGTAVVERTFDAGHTLKQVERYKINDIMSVPAMSQRLVVAAEERHYELSSLTALFTAGNAVPAASWRDIQRVLGIVELGTGYGMTEAPGITFMTSPGDPLEMLVDTVGRPKMSGVAGINELDGRQHRVMIVDKETKEPVADGVDGEILVGGPTVTHGYFDNDVETPSALLMDICLRVTSDTFERTVWGPVLTGRVKDMFKSGGENVTPKEVEAALYTHPAVEQAIVVGVPHPQWGETGCAWVVPIKGVGVTTDELVVHCRGRLARYKVPRYVYLVTPDDLPLTGLGKLKRQELVDMAVERIRRNPTDT